MDLFDHPQVPSLRQMAKTNLALTVCLHPEILVFEKNNGCTSFVFPNKKTHLYLGLKSPKEETWMRKDFLTESVSNPQALLRQRNVVADCVTRKNVLHFTKWEEFVEEMISSLPKLLQHELLDKVRSVSIEIYKWIKEHTRYWGGFSKIARNFLYDFQWNSFEKIDRGRTARKLIRNERVDIIARYILASLYSSMDKTPIKINLPDEIVEKFIDSSDISIRITMPARISFYETRPNNYFLQNDKFITLNPVENVIFFKTELLIKCLQCEDFQFFMSHMSDDESKTLFKYYAFKILRLYFLDCPLHCMFLSAAKQLLPYFTESEFRDTLRSIIYERIMLHRKDFNYIDLLKKFWSLSPSKLKESVKTDSIYKPLMIIINFPVDEMFPNEQLLQITMGMV
ncbi:uncharacterized protein TNIN_465771 [Trichonephila inaurata madagascariensis]|uniref:Uncharacterized protein n=1 Tax=Trichonephila inaurata madagascariensis TaxID=2747483 RepID=A0A8X6J781_9ARAC|nr:uncharacterized protein TNIN_465771 [Trichonephila inaurata madagascariensis]